VNPLGIFLSEKIITAESGQNVTLPCRDSNNNNITVVEWSKADLGYKYVFLHRDGQSVPANQHPSFKNRVDLHDRQMKDGDVSLILRNVTTTDHGIYECSLLIGGTQAWRQSIDLIVLPGEFLCTTELLLVVFSLIQLKRIHFLAKNNHLHNSLYLFLSGNLASWQPQ
uniref:Ig-like domain-containing protein n=1 Tax=Haplochromis burtoni TaxID=8153 RepID=A0A3Q2X4E3_HAPBU